MEYKIRANRVKGLLLIVTFFLLNYMAQAQDNKVLRLFEAENYEGVVSYYNAKFLEKEDAILLTKALLQVGNNQRALEISEKLHNEKSEDQDAIEIYYKALVYSRKYKEAYAFVNEVKGSLDKELSEKLVKDIEKYMIWEYDLEDIKVRLLDKINTSNDEYSPSAYNGKLYYCIDVESVISDKLKYGIEEINLSDIDPNSPSATSSFSLSGLSSTDYTNIGPFCLDRKTIYFTASTKKGVNDVSIIIKGIVNQNGKVIKETKMDICNKDYSVLHPAISEDGTKMLFASDMPGGFGGFDIYVIYKTPVGWSEPMNLGRWVNSAGNEVFPFYKDKTIFFSSDGLEGYGGLDIFKVDDDQYLEKVSNLRYPINSPFNDFGIFYTQVDRGYFTSDRPHGMGLGDIYSFGLNTPEEIAPLITGILHQNGKAIKNSEIHMIDADGNILSITSTDENGAFAFERQPNDGTYYIQIAEKLTSTSNVFLSLTDEAGNVTERVEMNEKGIFVFEMLPLDEVDVLTKFAIPEAKPFLLSLRGVVYKDKPGDLGEVFNIEILDKDKELLKIITSGANAKFKADRLDYNYRYLLHVNSDIENLKMDIVDVNGKLVQHLFTEGGNLFVYQHIGDPRDLITIKNSDNETQVVMRNEVIKIPNVYYEFGSAKLNGDSKQSLNEVVSLMKNNMNIKIELNSHTDSRGSANANIKMSTKRALGAKAYLVKNGIVASRIKTKGYGYSKQLIDCKYVECDEADHAQNRRTEFKIISN